MHPAGSTDIAVPAELELRGLTVRSGATTLVSDVNLRVHAGEVVALVGPSGSGKTLTLRAVLGLLSFAPGVVAGGVTIDGQPRTPQSLRGQVGLLFQDGRASLDPLRSLRAQLRHAGGLAGVAANPEDLLGRLGFPSPATAAERYPHELSGGMAQRAAAAAALARQSRFLLCDEPTTGLDAPVAADLVAELRRLTHVGVVFVTHDLRLLPGFADRILVMEGGRIVEEADRVESLSGPGRRLADATRGIAAPGWGGQALPVAAVAGKPLVSLRNLTVTHRRAWSFQPPVVAVDGVNLEIHGGEIVGLIGESGSGKSSLVRAACGLLQRESGEVTVLGVDPAIRRRPPPRAQLLVQDAAASLNAALTAREWLAESARVHRPTDPDAAPRALRAYGLEHRRDALPHEMSGGERRLLTLAALSLADPLVVFADEPTAGLDAARKADLLEALKASHRPDGALVLVTHDVLLARHLCSRLVFLHAGRIVDDLPTSELERATSPSARRILTAAGFSRWDTP